MTTPDAPTEIRSPEAQPPDLRMPDLGHPVRSFVLMVTALALVLIGLAATGVVAPQLSSHASGGSAHGPDGYVEQWVLVRNDSFVPVRITAVELTSAGWADVSVRVTPEVETTTGREGEPFEPFDLHGSRWLILRGRPDCDGLAPPADVGVRARTWSGIERTIRFDGMTGAGYCPDTPSS